MAVWGKPHFIPEGDLSMGDTVEMPIDYSLAIKSIAKRTSIDSTLSTTTGSIWALGLDRDGTGISNHMIIQNGTPENIHLHQYYLNWGCAKVLPEAVLQSQTEDDALFHAAGGWAATGSSGIVTYKLDDDTFLHVLWDCPYNFNHYSNFIGLYLCDRWKSKPSDDLFNAMYLDNPTLGIYPKQRSPYDLVCCGPGERTSNPNGRVSWGIRRPCEVMNEKFYVTMTMGDSHKTTSTVSVLRKSTPNASKGRSNKMSQPTTARGSFDQMSLATCSSEYSD